MWPLLGERPVCVKDSEPIAGRARSWTAKLSDEVLNYTVEARQALKYMTAAVTMSQTEYEGLWIFCDEKGTWAVLSYPVAKESKDVARNSNNSSRKGGQGGERKH